MTYTFLGEAVNRAGIDVMYRYDGEMADLGDVRVTLTGFTVIKHTPAGVWIAYSNRRGKRFVLLSGNKRFAHPTQEEALRSFRIRKAYQCDILDRQYRHARALHTLATCMIDDARYVDAKPTYTVPVRLY